jgi:hypothetical protein
LEGGVVVVVVVEGVVVVVVEDGAGMVVVAVGAGFTVVWEQPQTSATAEHARDVRINFFMEGVCFRLVNIFRRS